MPALSDIVLDPAWIHFMTPNAHTGMVQAIHFRWRQNWLLLRNHPTISAGVPLGISPSAELIAITAAAPRHLPMVCRTLLLLMRALGEDRQLLPVSACWYPKVDYSTDKIPLWSLCFCWLVMLASSWHCTNLTTCVQILWWSLLVNHLNSSRVQ